MINYFGNVPLFKSECGLNYRLSIINNFQKYVLIDNVRYIQGKIYLYQNSTELISMFDKVFEQNRIEFSTITKDSFIKMINEKNYIIGLYDSSKLPNSKYQESISNYNTFLMYGYENDKFSVWCNTSLLGPEGIQIAFRELKDMICGDLSVTKNTVENSILGFPISSLRIKNNVIPLQEKEQLQGIKSFYVSTSNNQNMNIFEHYLNSNMNDFIKHHYTGCQYQCAVNFRILKDMITYHNIILEDIYPTIPVVQTNYKIIEQMDQIISFYAKYIYTLKLTYIDKCLKLLESIVTLLLKNKATIKEITGFLE